MESYINGYWGSGVGAVGIGGSSYSSVQFSSVAQSCPTLCDPMNRSTPGLPVHHQPQFQPNINQLGIWWQIFQWSKIGNKFKWLGEIFWFFLKQYRDQTTAGHQLATRESDTLFHSGPGSLSPVYTSLSSIHQITLLLLLTTTNSRLEILPRSLCCHLVSTVTRPLLTFPTKTFHFNQRSLLTSSLTPARWPLFYPPLTPTKPTSEAGNKSIFGEDTFQHLMTAWLLCLKPTDLTFEKGFKSPNRQISWPCLDTPSPLNK